MGFSNCGSRVLERRLGSCGARVELPCGSWDLPRPGIEPMSPALAGGFLTLGLPRMPKNFVFLALPFSYWSIFIYGMR